MLSNCDFTNLPLCSKNSNAKQMIGRYVILEGETLWHQWHYCLPAGNNNISKCMSLMRLG